MDKKASTPISTKLNFKNKHKKKQMLERERERNLVRLETVHDALRHVGGHGRRLLSEAVHRRRSGGGVVGPENLLPDGLK